MTPPSMIERVARAINTHEVRGVVYADEAGSAYRVMSGDVAFGGDHVALASAQAHCDTLNASAALEAMRPPTKAMEGAGRESYSMGHSAIAIYSSMITAALSDGEEGR